MNKLPNDIIVNKLSKSYQKNIKNMSKYCQQIVKKMSKYYGWNVVEKINCQLLFAPRVASIKNCSLCLGRPRSQPPHRLTPTGRILAHVVSSRRGCPSPMTQASHQPGLGQPSMGSCQKQIFFGRRDNDRGMILKYGLWAWARSWNMDWGWHGERDDCIWDTCGVVPHALSW